MLYGDDEKENGAATRTNFFGEENVATVVLVVMACQAGGSRRKEKEEVVNVEKPRRNLKRRCIDSNRRLSYSAAADLQGTSRLVDIRRYCPAIPPPPFTPLRSVRTQKRFSPPRSVHSRRPLLLPFLVCAHII